MFWDNNHEDRELDAYHVGNQIRELIRNIDQV